MWHLGGEEMFLKEVLSFEGPHKSFYVPQTEVVSGWSLSEPVSCGFVLFSGTCL